MKVPRSTQRKAPLHNAIRRVASVPRNAPRTLRATYGLVACIAVVLAFTAHLADARPVGRPPPRIPKTTPTGPVVRIPPAVPGEGAVMTRSSAPRPARRAKDWEEFCDVYGKVIDATFTVVFTENEWGVGGCVIPVPRPQPWGGQQENVVSLGGSEYRCVRLGDPFSFSVESRERRWSCERDERSGTTDAARSSLGD